VNRSFADRLLGGADVLGRTVRLGAFAPGGDQADELLQVVGVVPDFPTDDMQDEPYPRLYRALSPAQATAFNLIVRTRGIEPSAYARRLRELAIQTSTELIVDEPIALDDALAQEQGLMRMVAIVVLLGTLSVLLLSAAGIYAMTSFVVAKRRSEVGIRAALGAQPAQLLRAIFARTAAQLAAGVASGLVLAAVLDLGLEGGHAGMLPIVAALMIAVGLLAALGPARRGLRIQPTQALREE
jgi:putative ABC transport system permease protein